MIVRCTSCNSAFAVKDEKVLNKKFAFTCPKCSHENIIDNKGESFTELEESLTSRDEGTFDTTGLSIGTAVSEKETVKQAPAHEEPSLEEDLDLGDFSLDEEPPQEKSRKPQEEIDTSLTDDLDLSDEALAGADEALDLTLEDESGTAAAAEPDLDLSDMDTTETDADEALTLDDLDDTSSLETEKDTSLDIGAEIDAMDNFDDIPVYDDQKELAATGEKPGRIESVEEDLLADFEPIDIDEEKPASAAGMDLEEDFIIDTETGENIKTEQVYSKNKADEEDITIDMDSLEIDLDEGDEKPRQAEKPSSPNEEDITLDLDTLDIDLEEGETISEGEKPQDYDNLDFFEEQPPSESKEEDITLDLDSLDIQLDETDEFKKGEVIEDDEKITLEDAGLTLEELTSEEISSATGKPHEEDEEEDIKLSIDDIDPSLSIDNIENELKEADSILSTDTGASEPSLMDTDEDLPDIDLDSFEDAVPASAAAGKVSNLRKKSASDDFFDEDLIDIDLDSDLGRASDSVKEKISDAVPGGTVNFSVDYSLKYSRLLAFLRLIQVFTLGLVPHFLVLALYAVLSLILGFINHIVVLSTKNAVEDFTEIQENTIRYFLSITASLTGFVDEMPIFAGRENLDYALQMNVIQPYRRSRVLAFLRLSFVGIILAALPHLLITGILAFVIPLIYLISIGSVIFTGRWPYFLFDFMVRYYRYTARMLSFMAGLIDRYPTFKFD
ncbi:MAG TPA: DUF4389 domain-containing protein [Spirochaetota bacterium]|nr:DUF4389 domain-containing protein [Spirochaetota bacterium]HPI89784.1 DUF4389 domain-containing protein [Spirochaetota bacterium]HPR47575.1 DUF4389 domain-containing protein [Spirochaetota bacterium]